MRFNAFTDILGAKNIGYETEVSMKNHTTFKIGGNADLLVSPKSVSELICVLKAARECDVPYFILGNGSNILVSDKGIEGAVIDMQGITGTEITGNEITCGAGNSLFSLCVAAKNASLSGLQFAYGIPGTVGGAFYMNAGAYGGEIKDVAISAVCLDGDFNLVTVEAKDMAFGYRTSAFQKNNYIIVSVKIALKEGKKEEISAEMDEIFKKRTDKQPLEYPSAGSTFKRPEGYYAGTLIEQNGLKGFGIGGAEVSLKHAGFVINKNGATADDVLRLIEEIKQRVKKGSGVDLTPEVMFVGRR